MNTTTGATSDTSATKRQSGSAALELGLIAPLFVVFLTGVAEIGRGAYEAMQVQSAVEAGMSYATNHDWDAAASPAAIANAVVGASGATGLTATPAPTEFCACHNADCGGLTVVSCSLTQCAQGCASEALQAPGTYVQINARLNHTTILRLPGMPSSFSATVVVRTQ